jgi:hypothetical protein
MYARSLGIDVARKQVKDLIVEIIQEEEMRKSKKEVVIEAAPTLEKTSTLVSQECVEVESSVGVDEAIQASQKDEVLSFNEKVEQVLIGLFDRVTALERKNTEMEFELDATKSRLEEVREFLPKVSSLEDEMSCAFSHISKIFAEIGWIPQGVDPVEVIQEQSVPLVKEKKDDTDVLPVESGDSKYPPIKVIQDMRLSDLKKVAASIATDKGESLPPNIQTKKQFLEYVIFGLSSLQEEGK